jgi:HK97 family phage major capsid protein
MKQELFEKKGRLANQADQILSKAKEEGRYDLTTDEDRQFNEIHAEIAKIDGFLDKLNKQESLATPEGRRSEPTPVETREQRETRVQTPNRRDSAEALRGWLLPGNVRTDGMRASAQRTGVSLDSREFVFKLPAVAMRSNGQTVGASDVSAWRQANDEHRAAFGSGSGAIGGYSVPDSMMQSLEVAQLAYSNIRSVARVIRTDGGGPLPFPTINDTGNTGALLGENTQVTELEPSFSQLVLDAYKFSSKSILVSVEFLQDTSIDAAAEIGRMLGERLGRITNSYFTTGTGTSQPKGVVAGAYDSTVTAASSTLYTHDELLDVIHAVDPAYRPQARFMFNDTTLKNLQKIKVLQYSGDTVGMPLWRPGLTDGAPNTILGYPYVINQQMASPGSGNKSVIFGDFSKFIIRDVRDIVLMRLDERYADYHQVAFLAFSRADSDVLDAGTHPIVWADHT